jgi:hypothetical protein
VSTKAIRAAATVAGDNSPGLRLNRRMKDILATGLLPSLSPSALTVLTYAAAHGDFKSCTVFLGAKTVAARAFNGRKNRNSVRRGIVELLDVGLLAEMKKATHRKATVYRLAIVAELVKAAQERQALVGQRRRRPAGEGAHGCAPRGHMDDPPGGTSVCPQGAHGCAPKHTSNVPSSLKERYASGRSTRRSQRQVGEEHERRLKAAAVKPRATA